MLKVFIYPHNIKRNAKIVQEFTLLTERYISEILNHVENIQAHLYGLEKGLHALGLVNTDQLIGELKTAVDAVKEALTITALDAVIEEVD